MLVSVPRLERLPSLKDMARDANLESMPFGLLGYPVLQAVDILLPRASVVPVGKDNQAHVELAREMARRFNLLYGPVFPEPEALIGTVPTLVGTDGKNKMSKSLDNAIFLSDSPDVVAQKVRGMYTDPNHVRADQPGQVEGNPVFIYLDAFDPEPEVVADLKRRYQAGGLGDVAVKQRLLDVLLEFLTPIQRRRAEFASDPAAVMRILREGTARGRARVDETLRQVHAAMQIDYVFRDAG
jgi:tryptophanyl-tRNA synthetase